MYVHTCTQIHVYYRFIIYNDSVSSLLVESLTPFTEYSISIAACTGWFSFCLDVCAYTMTVNTLDDKSINLNPLTTALFADGGCTESGPTVVVTSPSLPAGVRPPVATPHSSTFISVAWTPPLQPNGPNVRYELVRTKLRQPLDRKLIGQSYCCL